MNDTQRLEAFNRLAATMPNPKTELNYTNPYTLLVAVTLSAQATDVGVNKATKALFEVVHTPEDMVKLGLDGLVSYIKTIGLHNAKAKNLMEAARILVTQFDGKVPVTREQLEQLPGVGRKTANVVLNVAFHQPTIAVDTHIFRVCNRTGIAPGKTPLEVELKLEKVVPEHYKMDIHHWLILHGRYVCKARVPECYRCVLADLCDYNLAKLAN
ncbi:endonuclease III [Candidatus Paracaedibacter symbiosus]|uniref:endonuclease III n=1 Tax=Candidatus Paracaedibacter symbiosus TaxID=244582 RepID=UPI000509E964|nr:endonuclease III [Candidatus Paracaedibacter symbiosus]